jgi:hypothetical protein
MLSDTRKKNELMIEGLCVQVSGGQSAGIRISAEILCSKTTTVPGLIHLRRVKWDSRSLLTRQKSRFGEVVAVSLPCSTPSASTSLDKTV